MKVEELQEMSQKVYDIYENLLIFQQLIDEINDKIRKENENNER